MSIQNNIEISPNALNIQFCIEWIMSPESGGIDVFIGTVRNATKGKKVGLLKFEASEPWAIGEFEKIIKRVFE